VNCRGNKSLLAANELGDGAGGGRQQATGIVKSALHEGQFVAVLENTPLSAQLAGSGGLQIAGLDLQRGHTDHLGPNGECSVTHSRVEHGGDEAALHDVNAVTEILADIKLNGAGLCRGIDRGYQPTEHFYKSWGIGIELVYQILVGHDEVPVDSDELMGAMAIDSPMFRYGMEKEKRTILRFFTFDGLI
jgi:hypothetical protein